MATPYRAAYQRLTAIPTKVSEIAAAHPAVFGLTLLIIGAGILAFYLVILPPGATLYP
jgi:hypothetical protein